MATYYGDVSPVYAPNVPTIDSLADPNGDGLIDAILASGNFLYSDSGLSPSNPQGGVGDGLPWDAVISWRAWDMKHSISIGIDAYGELSAPEDLRPMDLIAGENANGHGVITLSGDTVFNNDRDSLPQDVRNRISFASGGSVVPAAVTYDMLGDETNHPYAGHPKVQQPAGNYNLYAGKAGKGEIYITSSKFVEVRHQVLIGGYYDGETFTPGVSGKLRIEQGSVLRCNGKFLADVEDPDTVTAAEPCQISVVGTLEMTGGSYWSRTGFVNAGVIDIIGTSGESPEMAAGKWTDDEEVEHTGQLENKGLLKIRKGVTFKLGCPLENTNGEVYLEAGAVLQVPSIVNEGLIHRSPCSPAAKLVVGGVTSTPTVSLDDLARE